MANQPVLPPRVRGTNRAELRIYRQFWPDRPSHANGVSAKICPCGAKCFRLGSRDFQTNDMFAGSPRIAVRRNQEVLLAWVLGVLVLIVSQSALKSLVSIDAALVSNTLTKALPSLVVCSALIVLVNFTGRASQALVYLLFFSISITSALGLTKTLTGSHAESDGLLLYGLSFYTTSLAYLISTGQLGYRSALIASNPLLLVTGPVAVQFGSLRHRTLGKRVAYFGPFLLLGLFLHQAIATPLTPTFFLIKYTDLASALTFGLIFELFVYANFCGLSLVVYGICGICGFKVPLNFRQPFSSTNLIDFWKGWHTSLSMVLKSLFYTPTRKIFGSSAAILVVYMASAMWHGITVNFMLWGLFHAIFFILTMALLKRKIPVMPLLLLLTGVVVGRMIFADSETGRLLQKLHFEFNGWDSVATLMTVQNPSKLALLMILAFVACEFAFQKTRLFRRRNYKFYRLPVVQVLLLVITLLTVAKDVGIDYAVYGQR
jgi:alginate O-acetyltransferase complex protein AlgI